MSSDSSIEIKQDPLWEWYSCMFDLKKGFKNKEVFYSLAPSIALNNPNSTEEKVINLSKIYLIFIEKPLDLTVNCSVLMEKSFIYSEEMGWNWHKSWNIPNIQVKIEVFNIYKLF